MQPTLVWTKVSEGSTVQAEEKSGRLDISSCLCLIVLNFSILGTSYAWSLHFDNSMFFFIIV